MTAATQVLGRHVWSELMTPDPTAAEKFYNAVVGWTSVPFQGGPRPYTIFRRKGDVGVAGLMQTPEGMHMPPFWAMYIGVPKLEDAVAKITRLGGSQLSPVIDIPEVGRMQMLKDPQGAAFYIDEAAPNTTAPEADPEIGDPSWIELMTTDAAVAMTFYQDLFGWTAGEAMDMGPMGKYRIFNRGGRMTGGMMNKPPEMRQVPPYWGIYFNVSEINAAAARVKANGGQVINGPMEVPGGDWILNGLDPQGAAFSLHAKKA